ncbi:FecR domain-containing protein [Chitinophaga sp. MM2321]|uniref:FecR family protein n=1 Tax=Chitinophaga sp. MM2321 TaxID=3137178 RepID=UPI0032D56C30
MEDNEQLKYLYGRYLRNQSSREELQAFFTLVNTLPDEAQIRSLLSRSWEEAEWQPDTGDAHTPLYFPSEATTPVIPLRRRYQWWKLAAALITGIALLAYGWQQSRVQPLAFLEKTTAIRQQVKVTLPDSSVVWLHAASKLRYPEKFDGKNREVFLEGKAFFEIHPDAGKPFLVHSGGLTTTVLGTSFNIDAYDDAEHIAVTVISGSVRVTDSLKVLDVLLPAQQINYNKRRQAFAKTVVDTTACVAWTTGKIKFDEEKMSAIAEELERWYGVQFLFKDDALCNCRYTASFDDNTSLEKLLDVICTVNNIRYTINEKQTTVTLTGKGCPDNSH